MKSKAGKIISLIFLFFTLVIVQAFAQDTVQILLAYPQKSNAPKREAKKIEEPVAVKGEVYIDIADIRTEQFGSPTVYVEYFLDGHLIYSTEEKDQPASLGFILDTRRYQNGVHTLVVDLWDKAGPSSAIGIRRILIQNRNENED